MKKNEKQKPKRKGPSSTLILILVFVIGLSVMLYPSISNYLNSLRGVQAVYSYDSALQNADEADLQRMLIEAQEYNAELAKSESMALRNGEPKDEKYAELLDIDGSGMMGVVYIKKLQVTLPIYHGTAEETLARYAGHIEGSSLPVGGESTHSVISAHRGLPAAKLFTDLDKLELGDNFTVTTLGQSMSYMVDDIQIISPSEADKVKIIPGEDHVTLLTCTPYGVNTHRLLVRGIRTDAPDALIVLADAMKLDPVIVSPLVAAPMLLILLLILLFGPKKKKEMTLDDVKEIAKDGDRNESK